jgi:carbonic anhydrase
MASMDAKRKLTMRAFSGLALLALAVPPLAQAAKWVDVAENAYGRSLYLDSESLQRDGLRVQAWTREVFIDEQRSPHTGVMYYSASTLTRFECGRRTISPLVRVFYGADGTELRRINLDQVELAALTTPGSLQERLLEEACKPPVAKKPAATHLAMADTRAKSDGPPPGSAAEPAKAAADKDGAKAANAEPQKAGTTTKPPEPVKSAAETKKEADPKKEPTPPAERKAAVKPSALPARMTTHELTKPAIHALVAPHPVPRKSMEPAYPYAYRAKARHPARLVAAADLSKQPLKEDKPVEHEVHWSYEGSTGPDHWSKLKPEFAACGAGKRQSPIDIQDGARLELEPIKFDYRPAPLRIVDNGHTVQINYAEGSSISISGVRYDLKQFHFHKPSEERVNGKMYDMVAHLVHQSADGRLAVVAVLMESGAQNDFLAAVWPHLPLEAGREAALAEVTIDVTTLLPESRTYFAFMGSLTTPPCSEGVLWLVMKTPVAISPGQVAVFGKLYKMNARPVQAGNGRLIKESL